jgi:hypothetical protein
VKTPHEMPGQLNVFIADADSDVTDCGRHNRIVILGGASIITAREDIRSLPLSTDAQRRKVMDGWQRLHPRGTRLEYLGSTQYTTAAGESIDHRYQIIRRNDHAAKIE